MAGRVMFGTMTLIAALLAAPATLSAGEHTPAGETKKDRCLVYGEECPAQNDDILQILAKLKGEIAKGEKVYTREEIQRLERKLKGYQFQLRTILYDRGR
jgi:hypothetical protein